MVTIILLCSRAEYIEKVISRIELLECNNNETNILCIVDGDNSLYIKIRNLIENTKFNNRLTVMSDYPGTSSRYAIVERRKRIAALHNQARGILADTKGHVFSIEDDTLIPANALQKMLQISLKDSSYGLVEGVELGRWGIPYVGAWQADDIYNTTLLTSMTRPSSDTVESIDAGGLYCTLVRADLYKNHEFTSTNGLGPDINLGLELRRLGYTNYIDWGINCSHLYTENNIEKRIEASQPTRQIILKKEKETFWRTVY